MSLYIMVIIYPKFYQKGAELEGTNHIHYYMVPNNKQAFLYTVAAAKK